MASSFTGMLDAYEKRRAELNRFIWESSRGVVISGLFQGMVIPQPPAWDAGDAAALVLGSYEMELHPILAGWDGRSYDCIINVGSGDGYYAVGLARRFPQIPVYAFEIDTARHPQLAENVRLNGMEGRITQLGAATPVSLGDVLARHSRALAVIDCEGAELDLVSSATVDLFRLSDLIVETHEHVKQGITEIVRGVLAPTHRIRIVEEGPRDPNIYPILRRAVSLDRWIAVCENRPSTMAWLVAEGDAA